MKKKFLIGGKFCSRKELDDLQFPLKAEVLNFLDIYNSPDKFFEVYTSGSTSRPKKIKIAKEFMRNSALATLKYLQISKEERILLGISPSYIGGIMVLVRWLEGELDLYTTEVSSRPLSDNVPDIHLASMVPLQVGNSLNHLSKVKKIIIGGAPISPELENSLTTMGNEIYQTYGMTETISHIAMRRLNGDRKQIAYTALPEVYFRADPRSCLIINAPYLGVNDLITNDVVDLLDEKTFIWKGRYDHVINSGGVKLFPEEIEQKIGELPFSYFITGIPDDKLGQKLVMIAESEEIISPEEINSKFKYLAKYEKPRELICLPAFIRTKTAKIARDKTLQQYLKSGKK